MISTYRSYNVFISSPSDVPNERDIAELAIKKIDSTVKDIYEITLQAKRWENMNPLTPFLPEEKIQDIIDREVKNSSFFILILNKRYGEIQPGYTISNTEREINAILKQFEKNRKIGILSYFKKNPSNINPDAQEERVINLKRRLHTLGILYKEYESEEEFRDLITHAIYSIVLKQQTSPYKKIALRNLWQFGKVEGSPHPQAAIIYPPVSREFMKPLDDTGFWFGRLQPNIYFEDYKGLYKIHKCLSLIGFHNYKIYPDTDMPDNLDKINRIWLCLPRLPKAVQYLQRYADIMRFKFHPRQRNKSGFIEWNINTRKKIIVQSPLNLYLKEQRKQMEYKGEWNSQLGKIFAKDYAIFARFKDTNNESPDSDGYLQDYFFAGIRGLGTWGATWFLDREHGKLKDFEEDANIELLLEVTYENGRIFNVKNVNEESKKYFENENLPSTIRKNIKAFREREHK